MENKDKKASKFKFAGIDDQEEVKSSDKIEGSFKEIQKKEFENKSLKDLVDASMQKPRKVPAPEELDRTKHKVKRSMYLSFETRVALRVVTILILFACACYFILEAVNYGKKELVTYDEITEANYNVCQNTNNYFDSKCLEEGLKYNQSTSNFINIVFKYNMNYSRNVPYDIAYHVVAITKIYDKENNTKVLFKNEDVLVERTSISDISDHIFFDNNINLEYKRYNSMVTENEAKYGKNSEASLEVVLYLDTDEEAVNVASVTIPLNEKTFSIRKSALSNLQKTMELDNNTWNNYNTMCAVIASILIILSLMILYRTTLLVLKVTNNKNKYEEYLNKILKTYDKVIVTAKDGYVVDSTKKIIKVAEFSELLDARKLLDQPIIYSKINSVKSEFVVEDESKAFKYVLKDSDL
ncbi:MAG: hypothetical protein IJI58_03405 [Bacilli bacterium]|nr:hypothetical protein [Bacilli bacterium]